MASNFLKRKAEERAKVIDEKYGEGTYGSTSDLKQKLGTTEKTSTTEKSSSTKSGGAETEKTKSKASSYLQKKAVDSALRNARNGYYNMETKEQGGNKDSWFKGGAFDDGYDFGDTTKTVLGTAGDIGLGALKGVGRLVEGLADLATYGVGGVGNLFGADEFWEDAKNVARYSATDEWTKGATDFVDKYSFLGDKSDAISEGLGQVAGIVATGGIGGAAGLSSAGVAALTTGVTGLSAMGTNMGEAYEAGATDGEAVVYGLGTGAIEAGTELLSGGLGKGVKALGISRGIGGLDDMFAKKLSNKVAGAFTSESVQNVLGNTIEASVKAGGEGFEELLSGAGSAVMKKLTYMDDKELDDLIKDENLLEQFVVGTIVSSIAQSPSYIKANKTGTDFVTGQTSNQERTINTIAEQEIAEREVNGEELTTREKNKIYSEVADEVMSVAEIAPTSLEQTAMDVVTNRNATQAEKTQPVSNVSTTDDSFPTQAADYLKTPENTQRSTTKGMTLAERLETQSKNNETLEVEDVKKATAFGEEGAKLVTKLANREGVTFSQAKGAVETAYRLGFTDIKTKKVRFDNSLQKKAFDAGKLDIEVQNRAKLAEAKNASVYETGFTENEYSAKLTADEREMFTTMSKDLKMETSFVDKIVAFYVNGKAQEANASHLDGKMEVSSTSEKPMVAIATHEGGHRMSELDPESFNVLMNYLYETSEQNARELKEGNTGISFFDQVRSEYGDNNDSMNTRDYVEEIAVRRLETIFSSAEEFNKWRAELDLNPQAKSAWQKFVEILKKVLEDMWAAVTNSKMSLEAKRQAQTELELFANAYRGAIKAAETRANEVQNKNSDTNSAKNLEIKINEEYNGSKSYSLKWRTDLNQAQYKEVVKWLRQEGNPDDKRITDTASWYKGRINGEDLFVIYSTIYANNPTILYEIKGTNARLEQNILLDLLEEEENGKGINGKPSFTQRVSQGSWMQNVNNSQNNLGNLGSGQNNQNAGVLQSQSQRNGSPAFWNVVEDIFRKSEQKRYSLKEETSDKEKAPTFYSYMGKTIDDMKQDKIGANSVVSYLTGRGVKTEEIKWSGIETFLEGKKSVSKAELQEFVAGSMLQIDVKSVNDDITINYTQEELAELDAISEDLDNAWFEANDIWNEAYGTDIPIEILGSDDALPAMTRYVIEQHGGLSHFEGISHLSDAERKIYDDNNSITRKIKDLEERQADIRERATARRDNTKQTKYHKYTLDGGSGNYRELLFKLPNSEYTNDAMSMHWGEGGVLAHARIQDFDVDGQKMLFIEEIQSDWHNEGAKKGYVSDTKKLKDELETLKKKNRAEKSALIKQLTQYFEGKVAVPEEEAKRAVMFSTSDTYMDSLVKKYEIPTELVKRIKNHHESQKGEAKLFQKSLAAKKGVEDAPFRNNYHEYVLKNLLRMAAEDGYDSIGWTTAEIQSQRWSDEYAEGYRIEYDQDIPKFLNKYGKKWGAKVGKTEIGKVDGGWYEVEGTEVWSMPITDSMKNSVLYEGQPQFSLKDSKGNTLTEAQQEYFKDSKVRDENGNLLVVYHGTYEDFTVFDISKTASANVFGKGHYFTNKKTDAQNNYASGDGADVHTKIEALAWNYFEEMGYTEADYESNDAVAEWNSAYAKAEEFYKNGKVLQGYLNMKNPVYAQGNELYDANGNFVSARSAEYLKELGYDGIIDNGVSEKFGHFQELAADTVHYVVFDSNQFKPTSNTNPTSNPDTRFSLKQPVEETKNLIAVHNMQSSELERTLDLGGLPMPSIAIIKAQSGHSEYGDVSLVFDKQTIDPKSNKNNKVYGGDAWTPTYPTIEYKPNEKLAKKISDKYYEFSRKFGYDESRPLYNYVNDLERQLNNNKGEAGMLEELYNDTRVMQFYLLDSGKGKVETINKETRTELTDAEVKMHEFFIKELGADVVDEVKWDGKSNPRDYSKNYMSKYEGAIREAYKKLLSQEYQFTEEEVQNVLDSTKPFKYLSFVRDAQKYRENGRVTIKTEADYEATQKAIKDAAGEDYRKWVDSLFKGIEEKSGIRNNLSYYTNSGNQRSWEALHWENNLENVVKVMKSEADVGSGTFFAAHSIWGVSAKNYGSIEEMKADTDRLKQLPEEEYNQIKEGFGERLIEIANSIMSKTERNPFIASDNAMECIVEAVRNSKTKSGILSRLKQYPQLTVTQTTVDDIVSLVNDISNMPTEYFEAKPKRAVELNEIATAIIPDSTSESIKDRLDSLGIKYVEYETGNENARLEALNSLEDIKFSLKGGTDVSPERKTEYLDAVKAVRKGKKGAAERLAKYVDSGMIRTEEYEQLIEKYGAIHTGERPSRDIQVPRKSGKNKKVSQTIRTVLEAGVTPDEAVPTIERMVEDGVFSYDVYTDKQAIENGEDYIKEHGWDESLDDWFDAVEKGEVSKDITTTGWILYNHAANRAATVTDAEARRTAIHTSLEILDAMVRHQRSAAQALQATRILKKLSPETQLYGVQKSVSALQKELKNKYGKKAPDLEINEELAEQFLKAETPEERAEVEDKIYKDIGRQMPSDWLDKWNAWRYLAMLGNPRTHIRNIVGNAGFAPVVAVKNLTATAIESMVAPVVRLSGKKMLRGKSIIWGNKVDRELLKAAWGDYGNVADLISGGGKYNDIAMANQKIEDGRAIFTSKNRILRGTLKPLEWARKGNSWLLEKEDMWFSKPHYAYALAQYCKANNITAEQIERGKAIAPARDYAIKEAQKATYRDTNELSQFVSGLGRNGKTKSKIEKGARAVIEGVLPFRKTPANILVRGLEYSPLGFLKGVADLRKVGKEIDGRVFTASEAIDSISAGLTGTGLLALGVYLAAQGLIRGRGEDEEEERKFKELMGHQSYALELSNGESITLDWLAPEALPFFVGVNIWETTTGTDEEVNLSSILSAVSNISDPMLEMSFLQGLNDVFESVGYAKSNDTSAMVAVLSSAVTNYLTQGIPTLSGQAERTGEENRMTTYTEKNGFLTGDMQYTLGKASAKIPFWDYNQIPYIDAWGRKEASGTKLKRGLNNFLNPAYTSTIESSKMEEELLRLFEETGEGGVFPERADKYFPVDGERKDLTAEEYVRYATLKGETSYKLVSDLVNSSAYKKLSDQEKAKAIKETYDYANQKAKESISNYKPDTWVKKADGFGANVGNYISFKTEVSSTTEENGGKISKQEVVDIILDMAQNDSETWKMYLSQYDAEKDVAIQKAGIGGEEYMNVIQNVDKYDKPNKNGKLGTYTNDEIATAISKTGGLTKKERAILWQEMTGSTSTKNNPWRNYLP